jgi:hypothetical protein
MSEEVKPNVKRRTSENPKPSMTIKRLWHTACFQPREGKGAGRGWRKQTGWCSLKAFARKTSEAVSGEWNRNKHGASNASRSDANIARISAEKVASRSAHGK